MASEEMSREEKEALLNIRMEEIRKKNAALQKRYEEVKADKQNAEEMSDTFQETHKNLPEPVQHVRRNQSKTQERQRDNARYKEMRMKQESMTQEQNMKRPQRLSEDDGPPPDPSYSFLADRSREGNSASSQDRRRDSRRHPGNFGGTDFENVKSTMEHRRNYNKSSPRRPPQNKLEMSMRMTGRERCEYERWRSERSTIENERMDRQKTSSGEWKREWDREKLSKNSPDEPTNSPRQWESRNRGRGGGRGRGFRQWQDRSQSQTYQHSSESEDSSLPRENRAPPREIRLDNESINVSFNNDRSFSGNNTWSTSSERRREYSTSSISEDDASNSHWSQKTRNPKGKEQSTFSQIEQGPQREQRRVNNRPMKDDQHNPDTEDSRPFEQRVYFVDNTPPPKTQSPTKDEPQNRSGDDLKDDESWDDEGSWEEATSGNGSPEFSGHSQEDFVTSTPGLGLLVSEEMSTVDSTVPQCDTDEVPQENPATVDSHGSESNVQLGSRESTPVDEYQETVEEPRFDKVKSENLQTDVATENVSHDAACSQPLESIGGSTPLEAEKHTQLDETKIGKDNEILREVHAHNVEEFAEERTLDESKSANSITIKYENKVLDACSGEVDIAKVDQEADTDSDL